MRVPATTANLGAGLDSLGLALRLYNTLTLEPIEAGREVLVEGEGADTLPRDGRNVVVNAIERLYQVLGRPAPPLRLREKNHVPPARGLGSSSAAIVSGLVGANALAGAGLSTPDLIALAAELDGHPDNVAACLVGGLAVTALEGTTVHCARVAVPDGLTVVLYIPSFEVSTAASRRALPQCYSRPDALFSLSRAALTVAALAGGNWDLLRTGTQDRLHQPHRAEAFPAMPELIAAALQAGARGAALSGSGPTIAAFTDGPPDPVAEALSAAGAACGLSGRILAVGVDPEGARVTETPA